jgi:hypothetical protein
VSSVQSALTRLIALVVGIDLNETTTYRASMQIPFYRFPEKRPKSRKNAEFGSDLA